MTVVYIINVDADSAKEAVEDVEYIIQNPQGRPQFYVHEDDRMAGVLMEMLDLAGAEDVDLEQYRNIETGATVNVSPVGEDEEICGEFTGICAGYRNGNILVEDQEGNVYELSPESVTEEDE